MSKNTALKTGIGATAVILGVYVLFNHRNLSEVIFGAIIIGLGVWSLASN
jgi:multisubunit Na+/H+ antiporter MnhC subunit